MTDNPHPTAFEAQILQNFLLSDASLSSITSLPQFTALFPAKYRHNPQVNILYHELHLARSRQLKSVTKAIDTESKVAGPRLRATLAERRRALRGDGGEGRDGGVLDGIELFGAPAAAQPRLPLKDLLDSMERALEELEDERMRMEEECAEVLEKVKTVVGDMSDLRYGKLANPDTKGSVVEKLENLVEVCGRKLKAADSEGMDRDGDIVMS